MDQKELNDMQNISGGTDENGQDIARQVRGMLIGNNRNRGQDLAKQVRDMLIKKPSSQQKQSQPR